MLAPEQPRRPRLPHARGPAVGAPDRSASARARSRAPAPGRRSVRGDRPCPVSRRPRPAPKGTAPQPGEGRPRRAAASRPVRRSPGAGPKATARAAKSTKARPRRAQAPHTAMLRARWRWCRRSRPSGRRRRRRAGQGRRRERGRSRCASRARSCSSATRRWCATWSSASPPRCRSNVDHEDLYSAGVLGLLDAYDKFDTGKGTKFETYAVWRIKGAVLDQLRALDWASRSMRRKAREARRLRRARLDQKLGRAATEEEVAREMRRCRAADFYRLHRPRARRGAAVARRDALERGAGPARPGRDHLTDPTAPDALARLEEEETRIVLLRHARTSLPEQERLVVALYYYEHMTLREIGRDARHLGVARVAGPHARRDPPEEPRPPRARRLRSP